MNSCEQKKNQLPHLTRKIIAYSVLLYNLMIKCSTHVLLQNLKNEYDLWNVDLMEPFILKAEVFVCTVFNGTCYLLRPSDAYMSQ